MLGGIPGPWSLTRMTPRTRRGVRESTTRTSPPVGTEARGVVEEVLDDLADAVGGSSDRRGTAADLEPEAHAAVLADVEAVDDLGEQPVERDRSLSLPDRAARRSRRCRARRRGGARRGRCRAGRCRESGRRSAGSSTSAAISAAVRMEVRGLRSSCETSAAKDSRVFRCASSRRVSSWSARARSPIWSGRRDAPKASGQAAAAVEDGLGLVAEAPQGTGDGGGDENREQHRDADGEEDDLEEAEALGVEVLEDAVRGLGDEDGAGDPAVAAEGDGAVERDGALSRCRHARRRAVLAVERGLDLGAVEAAGRAVELGGLESRRGRLEDAGVDPIEPGAHAVEQLLARWASCRADTSSASAGGRRAAGAMRLESASRLPSRSTTRRRASRRPWRDPMRPAPTRASAGVAVDKRRGEQPRLLDHAALLRAEEPVLVDVEVEETEERQEDEEEVEREETGTDAGERASRVGVSALRDSGSPARGPSGSRRSRA